MCVHLHGQVSGPLQVRTTKKVKIWDYTTGKFMITLTGHTEYVDSVSWSLSERVASSSRNDTIGIRDLDTILHQNGIYSVSFSPLGTELVSSSSDGKR